MSSSPDKAEQILPGLISAITPQKNRRQRYSVFVDDEFLVGVSESVLVEQNLHKGQKLTLEQFRNIQYAENYHFIRQYFLKLLGQRDHTRKELHQKARKKGIDDPSTLEIVLDELEDKDWIDHNSFAESFIRDKFRFNQWGPYKIGRALQQKGIERSMAHRLTDEYFEEVDLFKTFSNLVEKKRYKFNRETDTFRKRKKVFDYLRRKGYHTQQINTYIDRLMQELNQ